MMRTRLQEVLSWRSGATSGRGRSRGRLPAAERLETRDLLTAVPEMVVEINRYGLSSGVREFVELNGQAIFLGANKDGHGLYRSDGTSAGTVLIKQLRVGREKVLTPPPLYRLGNRIYFDLGGEYSPAEPGIWTTDGTSAGTQRLLGPSSSRSTLPRLRNAVELNGVWYFSYLSGLELGRTDGTAAGTWIEKSLFEPGYGVRDVTKLGNRLLIQTVKDNVVESWLSDGTPSGTTRMNSTLAARSENMLVTEDGVYFAHTPNNSRTELWKYDNGLSADILLATISARLENVLPTHFVQAGKQIFFQASNELGSELWRTDGTPGGTALVRDIHPTGSSNALPIVARGSKLYFSATDSPGGSTRLWVTDATTGETLNLHTSGSFGTFAFWRDELYFTTSDPQLPFRMSGELRSTDGTLAGTRFVEMGAAPKNLGDQLFFVRIEGSFAELRKLVSKEAPSQLVKRTQIGETSGPSRLTDIGGRLFFLNTDEYRDEEPWTSDGTEQGTFLLKNVQELTYSGGVRNILNAQGQLFFLADNGPSGTVLWGSDGSPGNATLLRDFDPARRDIIFPQNMTPVGRKLFFSLAQNFREQLWVSDGTSDGTEVIAFWPRDTQSAVLGTFTAVGDRLYFILHINGQSQLWTSDGTSEGTTLVAKLPLRASGSMVAFEGKLVFSLERDQSSREIWQSDGTAAGTFRSAVYTVPGELATILGWAVVGNRLFFRAIQSSMDLWVTDLTQDGTVRLRVWDDPRLGNTLAQFTEWNGRLYFWSSDGEGEGGFALWTSDGTVEGTRLVKDLYPGSAGGPVSMIGNVEGFLYFGSVSGNSLIGSRTSIWRSDGTSAGTIQVNETNWPSFGFLGNRRPARLGNYLYVAGFTDHADFGQELWRFDFTTHQAEMVYDLNPGPKSALISDLVVVGDTLYFSADNGVSGNELFALRPELPRPGDLDRDQDVDSEDLQLFLANWTGALAAGAGDKELSSGDLDGDRDVDSADLLEFLSRWTGALSRTPPPGVPTPAVTSLVTHRVGADRATTEHIDPADGTLSEQKLRTRKRQQNAVRLQHVDRCFAAD